MVGKKFKLTGKTYADLIDKAGKEFQIPNVDPQKAIRKSRRKKKR